MAVSPWPHTMPVGGGIAERQQLNGAMSQSLAAVGRYVFKSVGRRFVAAFNFGLAGRAAASGPAGLRVRAGRADVYSSAPSIVV